MSQYLYKKDSFKKIQQTSIVLDQGCEFIHVHEVETIQILSYNIDGKGSALIEKYIVEVVKFVKYGRPDWRERKKNIKYAIISYSKLEELMLSADWVVSAYYPSHCDGPIEEIVTNGFPMTKEE